jgi:integrase
LLIVASGKTPTISNTLALVSAALELAVRDGDIPSNPARGAAPIKRSSSPQESLSHEEFMTLVELVPERYRPLILTLGLTGMRWGEATAIQVRHVRLDSTPPRIIVEQAWKDTAIEGRFEIGPPKSDRGKRTIFVDGGLAETLRPLVEDREQEAFVFQTEYGNPIRRNNFHHRYWRPVVLAAWEQGLVSFVPRIHDLRHAHATWALSMSYPVPSARCSTTGARAATRITTSSVASADMRSRSTMHRRDCGRRPRLNRWASPRFAPRWKSSVCVSGVDPKYDGRP